MTTELIYLAWSVVLGLVHAVATGQVTTIVQGPRYAMGPRDEDRPLGTVGGRVVRAYANFMQTFPLFAAAVLVAHVAGRHTALSAFGAALYFWARVVYVPLYAAGIPVVRTAAFLAALAGIVLVLLALR